MKDKSEYICDDRIYEPGGLMDQIRSMSDAEFEKHIEELFELVNFRRDRSKLPVNLWLDSAGNSSNNSKRQIR